MTTTKLIFMVIDMATFMVRVIVMSCSSSWSSIIILPCQIISIHIIIIVISIIIVILRAC